MKTIFDGQQSMLAQMQQLKGLTAAGGTQAIRPAASEHGTPSVTFQQLLQAVDLQQHQASQAQAAVDSGQSKDLVGAMIKSQQASLSFSALMQVRNKVSTAFDEIMRMPI